MPADILRIRVRAVPVGEGCLLPDHAFSGYELAVPQHVGARLLQAPFLRFLFVFNHFQVAVQVNTQLTVDEALEPASWEAIPVHFVGR